METQMIAGSHCKNKKSLLVLFAVNIILFLLVAAFVYTGNKAVSKKNDMSAGKPDTPDLVSAVPETTAPAVISNMPCLTGPAISPAVSKMNTIKKTLESYIGEQEGKYGLYYINLISGEEFGVNERDEFIAASTTKLPMNMLLYKEIATGKINFESILIYNEEDYEPGTGIIQESPFGTPYTVREAARLSIVYSDNCAMNMIIRLLGIDNIRKYMLELGGTIYYGDSHRTCPYDLALYAAELYRFYMESPEIAGILMEDLQNTHWNDRINKLLPDDIKVAHKIGNYPKVYNDAGIVFAPEPYVLAVMSEDIRHETASDVIATISKIIYDCIK